MPPRSPRTRYSTKFMMPESNSFVPAQAAPTLSDPNAEGLVSIIAGHIYQTLFGGSITPYPAFPAGDITERTLDDRVRALEQRELTWAQALTTYGESIHNSMVTGQYNAYVWWGVFGSSTGSCATAAGTCGLVDNAGNVQPMGYVMGQYSKFIAARLCTRVGDRNPGLWSVCFGLHEQLAVALRDRGHQLQLRPRRAWRSRWSNGNATSSVTSIDAVASRHRPQGWRHNPQSASRAGSSTTRFPRRASLRLYQ